MAVTTRPSSRQLFFDENMQLKGWSNENTGEKILVNENETNLCPQSFSGVHIISPKIFEYMKMQGKFSIITAYLELAKSFCLFFISTLYVYILLFLWW